jgi:hypothetical protein
VFWFSLPYSSSSVLMPTVHPLVPFRTVASPSSFSSLMIGRIILSS